MALALVEADLGAATANLIARHFVLYARRPGYQSQFSPLLQAQTAAEAPFAALIDWMQENLDQPLDVPTLAARAGLTERSFYRKFTEATGKTPAHFVEGLRLDAARTLLTKGLPIKTIAGKVGLNSPARFGQAFERRFGMAPSLFREMHRAGLTGRLVDPAEDAVLEFLDRAVDLAGDGAAPIAAAFVSIGGLGAAHMLEHEAIAAAQAVGRQVLHAT